MSDFLFQEIYIIPELEWSLHSSTVLFLLVYFTRKRICNCIHPCEHFQRHMKAANMQLWASWGVHIYHVCWHQYNVARNWFQMEMFCHSHTGTFSLCKQKHCFPPLTQITTEKKYPFILKGGGFMQSNLRSGKQTLWVVLDKVFDNSPVMWKEKWCKLDKWNSSENSQNRRRWLSGWIQMRCHPG